MIGGYLDESQIYRIDHYLGKETVQNILRAAVRQLDLRADLEPQPHRLRRDHRRRVDRHRGPRRVLRADRRRARHHPEPPAPGDVARDDGGARRRSRPTTSATRNPRSCARCARSRSTTSRTTACAASTAAIARSTASRRDSQTPTYAAMRFMIDSWRWQGVPFYLRAGKKLARAPHRGRDPLQARCRSCCSRRRPPAACSSPPCSRCGSSRTRASRCGSSRRSPARTSRSATCIMTMNYADAFKRPIARGVRAPAARLHARRRDAVQPARLGRSRVGADPAGAPGLGGDARRRASTSRASRGPRRRRRDDRAATATAGASSSAAEPVQAGTARRSFAATQVRGNGLRR